MCVRSFHWQNHIGLVKNERLGAQDGSLTTKTESKSNKSEWEMSILQFQWNWNVRLWYLLGKQAGTNKNKIKWK